MREYGYNVEIIQPPVDEPDELNHQTSVYEHARALSFFKAQAVARLAPDAWIIAGDTIAAQNQTIFGTGQVSIRGATGSLLPVSARADKPPVARELDQYAIFGKPRDRADAKRILSAIAGTTHEVITGVTLLDAASGARQIEHDVTRVTMRRLGDDEIEAYLDTGAWQGKAGAYGIQDRGDAFVERIDGSFTNVVGFPMELIERMLQTWGVPKAQA